MQQTNSIDLNTILTLVGLMLTLIVVILGGAFTIWKMSQNNKDATGKIELMLTSKLAELRLQVMLELTRIDEQMKQGRTEFARMEKEIQTLKDMHRDQETEIQKMAAELLRLCKRTETVTPERK